MSINKLFFGAAVLFISAITVAPQFAGDAHASCSEADSNIFREARSIVVPYDVFFNSVVLSVKENVVTVSGYIDSVSAKRKIGESIAALNGVKKVRNDMIVRAR